MAPDAMDTPNNPYAPPKAPVADAAEDVAEKNPHVELACRLIWISLFVSLLDNVVAMFTMAGETAVIVGQFIGTVVGLGIGALILVWITRKLRAGRNWMRWLLTIINVLAWLSIAVFWNFYFTAYSTVLASNPLMILSTVAQTIIGIAFIVLLHTPTSRAWFRAQALRRPV